MADTRRLTDTERESAKEILESARQQIAAMAGSDAALLWAIRRYVYIRLQHDERGTPMQRKMLKMKKWMAQKGKCAMCNEELPERGAELDRFNSMKGYTAANTRLVCQKCHREDQAKRGFA
jgi:ribosomal protein L44E